MIPDPVPQVGAVLDLDTKIPGKDHFKYGDKHWHLNGSCVLVEPNRILTVSHVLDKNSTLAAFFPYEGIFEILQTEREVEPQVPGDNLLLVKLKRSVRFSPPLTWRRYKGRNKPRGFLPVCGYGSWPNTSLDQVDGVQMRHRVELGRPRQSSVAGWSRRTHNLDLNWSSVANGDRVAGFGNSGGPMLWIRHGGWTVAGINREVKHDQQIGSWIGRNRDKWLQSKDLFDPEGFSAPKNRFESSVREIDKDGETVDYEVPKWAKGVQATLSASSGLRLQMKIAQGTPDSEALKKETRETAESAGRFLFRTMPLDQGVDRVTIAVAPYERAPKYVKKAVAQICVLFTDEPLPDEE